MAQEKTTRVASPWSDAKEAVRTYCASLHLSDNQESELLHSLANFSSYLISEELLGLTSATFSRAFSFLKLQYAVHGEIRAEQQRKSIEFFFRCRGDLRKEYPFPALDQILAKTDTENKRRHYAKSLVQANRACAKMRLSGTARSVGTQNTYRDCLRVFCDFIKQNKLGDLQGVSQDIIDRFLAVKCASVGQKTCEKYKQATQAFLRARGDLEKTRNLPPVRAEKPQKLSHRAYTPEQVELIKKHLTAPLAFSTELSYRCGLRAHELLTIERIEEKKPDQRFHPDGSEKRTPWKFSEREGVAYVVTGKGGLTREIRIPPELSLKLECLRLTQPQKITDRGIHYKQFYDVVGGKRFTDCFRRASLRALGWSTGAHGLRHSYAQERMYELQRHCTYEKSKETVSQELGHFRPDITDAYLR